MPDTILIAEGREARSRALRENLTAFLRYRLGVTDSGEDASWPQPNSSCLSNLAEDLPSQRLRRDPGRRNPGAGPQMVTLSV